VSPLAAERGFDFADPYAIGLLFGGLALFVAIGALSHEHGRAFSPAVAYLLLAVAAAAGLELLGVSLFDPLEEPELIERVSEVAVIIALFSAGLKLDRPFGARRWRSGVRLLGVVMPLTIGAVALFGHAVMGLSLGAAVLLGAILAPTDPVLASDVQVGPPGEQEESEPRFALTAEAGFNDGLAFPFVFLGIFIAGEGGSSWIPEWLAADVVYAIAAGVAIGFLAGRGASALVTRLHERGWLERSLDGWLAIGTVLAVYGVTEVIGAYGFIAAFVGGLSFRRYERTHEFHGPVHEGAQTVEKVAELATILLVVSTVTVSGLGEPGLSGWLLVPVLLLVVRPAAVLIGFAGSGMPRAERWFIGWFGIRGIGSFYYAAVALGAGVLSSGEAATVFWTVMACVIVSIVAHGVSAAPLASRLVDRA
jgi:NhaP-type Na+/H+ or K+/H+ antiporter